MAIQINPKTAIFAGVGVLVLAGAVGAWLFLFEEDAPPPARVAAKAPAKAAAKAPDAAKAPAAKTAEAPKAAAKDAKPAAGAKPIPTDPNKLVAEIVEVSGAKAALRNVMRDFMSGFSSGNQGGFSPEEVSALRKAFEPLFDPAKMTAELEQNLKTVYDGEKMGRFLELLRHPVALKMAALESRPSTPEMLKEAAEIARKNPERAKLIDALDALAHASETAAEIGVRMSSDAMDALFDGMRKAGKTVPKQARDAAAAQLQNVRGVARSSARASLFATYRDVSDAELAEYIKVLDTETGRWGTETLVRAMRSVLESRARPVGREMAQVILARKPAAAKPEAVAAEAARPAAPVAVAAAPAQPQGYRRPEGIRELYTRYNDLVTAVVMRDGVAVKELLADGKDPDSRQSDGLSALMVAASYGDTAIAELLLAKGANPNLRAPGGVTALSAARAAGKPDMVRLLERHGAKG